MLKKIVLISSVILAGCNMPMHKPSTIIKAPGVYFRDTKDNDISADKIAFDGNTKSGEILNLQIRNNASDPINNFVNQQAMYLEGMKEQTKQTQIVVDAISSIVGSVVPVVGSVLKPATTGPLNDVGATDVGALGLGSVLALGGSALLKRKNPVA